jgi:16S rRNA (guanine(966)-N(2))-methyltransferase RsmD
MRVIAGEFRSRRLKSIPGDATRPTPDRLREALFNILQERIRGATFLDAYAGTGAVGIEALSRGASHAYFLEHGRLALDAIRENLGSLGLYGRSTVKAGPVLRTLPRIQADIVFLDPPYSLGMEYRGTMELLGAGPPALVIAQHSARAGMEERYGSLVRTRVVKQGENALSFFEPASSA